MGYKVSDVEYLKEYLKYAMLFEKNVYVWSKAMNEANSRRSAIYNRKKYLQENLSKTQNKLINFDANKTTTSFENDAKYYKKISRIALTVFLVVVILCVLLVLLMACAKMELSLKDSLSYFWGTLSGFFYFIIFVFLGIFCGTIGSIIGPICIYVYRKSKKKAKECEREAKAQGKFNYSLILENESRDFKKELEANVTEEKSITKSQEEIISALNTAKKNLSQLYSENILPLKYRTFNAVATMYEYLETGRCITIRGHGGLYDTYENDLKLGLIVKNLENINETLSRMESTQYLLYKEIQNANSTLRNINSSLDDIKITNTKIAQNTAISAEANRQTAEAARWFTYRAWARGF